MALNNTELELKKYPDQVAFMNKVQIRSLRFEEHSEVNNDFEGLFSWKYYNIDDSKKNKFSTLDNF